MMCQGNVISKNISNPGIICLALYNSFKFPENAYIVNIQVAGINSPSGPQVIVANAMNIYASAQTIIFCLFFLENKVFDAQRIELAVKIVNSISVVASLENTSVPKLVAKIIVIINAYDLDNKFLSIEKRRIIPNVAAKDIGILTISALIFSKIKQEKFINQKRKGG